MARKLRVEYPGAVDHVMNRGNQGGAIFRDDLDRCDRDGRAPHFLPHRCGLSHMCLPLLLAQQSDTVAWGFSRLAPTG